MVSDEAVSFAVGALAAGVLSFAFTAVWAEGDTENQFERTCHALADTRDEKSFCVRLVLDASD